MSINKYYYYVGIIIILCIYYVLGIDIARDRLKMAHGTGHVPSPAGGQCGSVTSSSAADPLSHKPQRQNTIHSIDSFKPQYIILLINNIMRSL